MAENKMNAVVKTKKAPGAEILHVDIPRIKQDEVLVKVHAAAICGTDVSVYKWNTFAQAFYKKVPNIMGHEMAGEVVEVGGAVRSIKIGDLVSAETHITCGCCFQCRIGQQHLCANTKILGFDISGCFADYVAIPESVAWKNDPSLPMDIASVQEPLGNAVYCTLVEPVAGKSVVILGDGPIGLFAVEVAKASGASLTVLVGLDPFRLNIGKKLRADVVLDAVENDVKETVLQLTDGVGADVVMEMAGAQEAVTQGLDIVRKGGRYCAFGVHQDKVVVDYNSLLLKGITIYGIHGRLMFDTWIKVKNMLDSGLLNLRPVITHNLPLTDFEDGFSLILARPMKAAKVVLYPNPKNIPAS